MANKLMAVAATTLIVAIAATFWGAKPDDSHDSEHSHEHTEQEFVVLSPEDLKANQIEMAQADSGLLRKVIHSPATIVLHNERIAHVLPKVVGNAGEAYKNLGETVQAGELLAVLESREMAETKADYLAASKKYNLNESIYQREKNLYEKKITSEQEYQNALHSAEEAQIVLELTRQKLYALGLNEDEIAKLPQASPNDLRIYEMRSPIAGRVIGRHFNSGELMNLDHEAFVIADLGKVWSEIIVFPQDLHLVKQGQQITISCQGGETAEANVVYVSPVLSEDTRTATVIAEIDNESGKFAPGTFGCANLVTEEIPVAIIIPKSAVQEVDGRDTVFVTKDEGFEPREVKLGRSDDSSVEVLSGLVKGETYAATNTFLLKAELKKSEAEHMD